MKKHIPFRLLFFCSCLFFTGCETATPEKYFNVTVLNSNLLVGFAGYELSRDFLSPTVKMGATKDEYITMKRSELLADRLHALEEAAGETNRLSENDDAKEILQNSKALYNYVLPVYKNEYAALAKLYDEAAPKEQIEKLTKQIEEQYHSKFEELYKRLISSGKAYAQQHSIKVHWAE